MARANFTRKQRAEGFLRCAGKCENCGARLKPGEGEADHILACELGGEATLANMQILCRVCHREKTGHDIRRVRKSDRQRDKASGAMRPSSRGFRQWRKFNGEIVRRT